MIVKWLSSNFAWYIIGLVIGIIYGIYEMSRAFFKYDYKNQARFVFSGILIIVCTAILCILIRK